jgi:ubiquinone/menaquinone biosynthesis C-methylase UbiE
MQLSEAITLIKDGFQSQQHKASWADLGCGAGLFTQALACLLPPESVIYAIDKSKISLSKLSHPAKSVIRPMQMDFEKESGQPSSLDGILMANSLHYVRDKTKFVQTWQAHLKPDATFVIVEYDTEKANPWVPFPVSFSLLKILFEAAGYTQILKIGSMPSQYRNGNLYAALATR